MDSGKIHFPFDPEGSVQELAPAFRPMDGRQIRHGGETLVSA